jgi:hypothetical protein
MHTPIELPQSDERLPPDWLQRTAMNTNDIVQAMKGATSSICLLPRNSRKSLVVRIPHEVSVTMFRPIVEESLQETMPCSNIYIMKIEAENDLQIQETSGFCYLIVFLQIPKQMTERIAAAGIKTIICYIGYSENEREYKFIEDIPDLTYVATHNRDADPLPYNITITI